MLSGRLQCVALALALASLTACHTAQKRPDARDSQSDAEAQANIAVPAIEASDLGDETLLQEEAKPEALPQEPGTKAESEKVINRLPAGFETRLSATRLIDGAILIVELKVPEAYRDRKISGAFEGISIPFFPSPDLGEGEYEGVLGVPFAHKPGPAKLQLRIEHEKDLISVPLKFTIRDGKYPREKLRVSKKITEPDKAAVERILREQKEIRALYRILTPKKYWSGKFAFPIKSKITSRFGTKRIFNGKMKSFHQGLDLRAPLNTPIHAPAAGVVVLAKDLFFTGNTVIIDHGYGIFTIYAHMNHLDVKKGDMVKRGALLGLSGKTGRAAGPHLHWGAVVHKQKVNPIELTRVMR